ncbi:MAG TPA: AsmA-like C-terminal region-containing protein [Xanthomonadales bacterium]
MRKLFKWLSLSIIALAVCVAAVLYNPGLIRGPLERYLSKLAGYSITIEGNVGIAAGRLIEITANDIHVSGPDWAGRKDLVAVGHLNLALQTTSIFKDIVVIESLQVDKLQLNLETNAGGDGNWPRKKTPSPKSDHEDDGSIVIFKQIQANDATLRYRNGKTEAEHVFNIVSLKHHQQADGMLHTTLNGALNDRPVEYMDTIGPYRNLLDGRAISYTATGHFGELALKGEALIDDLLKPRQPIFSFDLQGPDIDEITAMLGAGDLGSGDFSLHAKSARVDGAYTAGIKGEIGDISLDVSAQTSDISQLDKLDLTVAAKGPNLDSLTRVFGIEKWPGNPFSLNGKIHRDGRSLNIPVLTLDIGGTKLLLDAKFTNFPGLDASRVKLTITGDDIAQFRKLLNISGPASGAFELNGTLDVSPEGAELLDVDFVNSLGHVTLAGTLGPSPAYIGSKLDLHINGDNANSVMAGFGWDILPEQPFKLSKRLEVTKGGLLVDQGTLLTIGDEVLEAGGFVAFDRGGKGTGLDVNISGKHLAQVLGRDAGGPYVPDSSYKLGGHVKILEEGLRLENTELEIADARLKADGLIALNSQLSGTGLDFKLNGDDLSSLKNFKVIGNTLDIFVPGQPYEAAGRFTVDKSAWKFSGVNGNIGKANVDLDVLISRQDEWEGSNVRFSVKGPDLNGFLVKKDEPGLPSGAFESSARVMLSGHRLSIEDFNFSNNNARGKIDMDIGWPVDKSIDARFNVDVAGDDIRNFLPHSDLFEAEKAAFQLSAAGKVQDDQLNVDHFNAKVGNLQATLEGRVINHPEDENAELSFNISSADISKIGQLRGEALPPMALDIKANFVGSAEQFALRKLVGSLGESRLNGDLDVSFKGPKPDIKLTATSDYIDIRPFLKQNHSKAKAGTTPKADRLIPAIPIPLDAFTVVDMNIRLDVSELQYPSNNIRNLILNIEQRSGSLLLQKFSFEAPRGKLDAALSITPDDTGKADVTVNLSTEGFVYNYSGLPKDKLEHVPAFDIDFHAGGKGADLREVAGNLNGSLYVGSSGGNAENVDLGVLNTFVLEEIFSLILPKSKQTYDTQFSCIAAIVDISDGLMKTNPALAFTSQRVIVVSKGTLDLKTEKMNFNFNATPSNALKISATEVFQPYILISGTLAKPSIGVDPGKTVLHGGAAIATLGTSVLAKGVLDRLGTALEVCEDMLKKTPQKK